MRLQTSDFSFSLPVGHTKLLLYHHYEKVRFVRRCKNDDDNDNNDDDNGNNDNTNSENNNDSDNNYNSVALPRSTAYIFLVGDGFHCITLF